MHHIYHFITRLITETRTHTHTSMWRMKDVFVYMFNTRNSFFFLLDLQTSESMKFKTNNSLRGLTVNVSWAPQGGSMKYTMKMHPMRCGMPDDVNKIREEVTESDSIIMRDLGELSLISKDNAKVRQNLWRRSFYNNNH